MEGIEPARGHQMGPGRFARSLCAAVRGVAVAVGGRNLRLQLVAGALVTALALWLGLDGPRLALVLGCVPAVLSAEILNTAIERLCDLVDDEHGLGIDPRVRDIKDLAAGGVLVTSLRATTVGLLLLGPPLLAACTGAA
jgi:diacylglycerol kinase